MPWLELSREILQKKDAQILLELVELHRIPGWDAAGSAVR